ncbi:TniQ family protein [Pseudomonas chlororaphis]|uniref:TniQ family protein n=1 Tax=Pseudomonas chlororaphis TaxID=587753 RepID=UPI0015DEA145|nr:TniQ family protein [Pseudomonas chlororaphis]QLL13485.1 TniQ family protein [Pseudomonas chlororaphis subsp. aurantiaca]
MMSDLLFFPVSMPDEMLHSRITRYHFLSGNRTAAETYRDLFGSKPFCIGGIVPKQIEGLADRLPGQSETNLGELISSNTTFPAYRPFLGVRQGPENNAGPLSFDGVVRIPRREESIHGKAKLCPTCVQEDLIDMGYAYWHRSHHIPGVAVCWRHGDSLIHACPKCSHPFYRKLRLLPNLTEPCACGWSPLNATTTRKGSNLEKKIALFAHDILQRNIPPIGSAVLSSCYVRQCKKRGFIFGNNAGIAKLFGSIQGAYGDELLSQIDPAYNNGKHEQWIRLKSDKGQLNMPLARHLIIALHLFASADDFEGALKKESILLSASTSLRPSRSEEPQPDKKTRYRKKVEMLLALRSDANVEYLWKKAYKPTQWITENDNAWLMAKLRAPKEVAVTVEKTADLRDAAYAALIEAGVDELYRVTKDLKRVNIRNLQTLLPSSLPHGQSLRKQRFPLTYQQIKLHQESVWHFRLRTLVWTISELARMKLPMNYTTVRLTSVVASKVFLVFSSFFEWDLESFARTGVKAEALLKSTGVSRNWEGPPVAISF